MSTQMRNTAYMEASTNGASELEVLVVVYDAMTVGLYQAAEAVKANDVAQRCARSNRVLLILGHLENWAMQHNDPPLAESLCTWYQFLRQRLLQIQSLGTYRDFAELAELVSEVRGSWKAKEDLLKAERAGMNHGAEPLQTSPVGAGWSA